MTRILVADDDALIRGGLMMLLAREPDIEIVGEAADGDEAVAMSSLLRPDIVLMDVKMPGMDGVEATRILTDDTARDADALLKVLIVTTFNDDASVYGALRSGASGILVKDNAPKHLVTALRTVAFGDSWIDPTVAGQVIKALNAMPTPGAPASHRTSGLTAREREVLVLMAEGLSNPDISRRLTLSEATVRTHVSRVLMKTSSHDRTQAVVLAYQTGLVAAPRRL